MITGLAGRELRLLFLSPLPWILLALGQLVSAWWFLSLVDQFQTTYQAELVQNNIPMGVTDLVLMPFFGSEVVLGMLLMAAALLAMRLVAEERRSGTIRLLYASPVSVTEIVLGKYFAAVAFLLLMMVSWLLMPAALLLGTEIDLGRLASAGLGLLLLGLAMAGMALLASTLTAQPAVAVALTVTAVLALRGIDIATDWNDPVTGYLALLPHYEALVQGQVVSVDIIYFLLLTAACLGFSIKRLDALRLQAS